MRRRKKPLNCRRWVKLQSGGRSACQRPPWHKGECLTYIQFYQNRDDLFVLDGYVYECSQIKTRVGYNLV